ncbi:hypothetical protein AB6813_18325 [bacterium RCC_150]
MAEAAPVGAGSAYSPKPPEPDGSLLIRGGVGGISFQFEELLAGAALLEELVQELRGIETEAEAVRTALFPFQAASYASGSRAIISVGESAREIGKVRDQLQGIGNGVRASHREYEFAEVRATIAARLGIRLPDFITNPSVGLPNPVAGLSGARDAMEGVVQGHSGTLALLLGVPTAAFNFAGNTGGRADVGALIRGLAATPALAFLKPRPVAVSAGESAVKEVDTSVAGLLRELGDVWETTSGEIEIVQLDKGGERAWVVLIPGTQPGSPPGGSNPLDEAGIAEALGYNSGETGKAVREALRAAGAAASEPVVAVGHSQGGIHAMNLSQDRAFLAEYNLKFVVTAGSPVGGITPQDGVGSLHLEHQDDWVPGADGTPNGDTKDRVTVTMTNPAVLAPGEEPGLGPAHRLSGYEEGARLVQASSAPSLAASTATLGAILGAGGLAKVSRFKLSRQAAESPRRWPGRPNASRALN